MKYSIALCFDANYQVQTRTVMQTIIKYGLPKKEIDFYLVTEDREKLHTDAFESLHSDNVQVRFITLSDEHKAYIDEIYESLRCPKKKYISKIAIAKCLLPLLVPDCDRLLYLDSDMIVVDDISELWDLDMEGYSVAAVPDLKLSMNRNNYPIRFSSNDRYFNSGLVVYNLNEINKTTLLESLASIYADRKRKFRFVDQDQLNVQYHDSVKYLPVEYNLFARFPNAGKEFSIDISELMANRDAISQLGGDVSAEQIENALKSPRVVHFVTRRKPWNAFGGYKYELWRDETCGYNWSGYYLDKLIIQHQDSFKYKESLRMKILRFPVVKVFKILVRKLLFRR